jgi:cupin 2 domain-containing protein
LRKRLDVFTMKRLLSEAAAERMERPIDARNPENLFAHLPEHGGAEQFRDLLTRPGIRIERIVSTGQTSPPGFWYDQPHAEWVLLISGEALLKFEDDPAPIVLKAGSYVDIAPHRRHRVEWTDPDQPTIWLAVYYEGGSHAPVRS